MPPAFTLHAAPLRALRSQRREACVVRVEQHGGHLGARDGALRLQHAVVAVHDARIHSPRHGRHRPVAHVRLVGEVSGNLAVFALADRAVEHRGHHLARVMVSPTPKRPRPS